MLVWDEKPCANLGLNGKTWRLARFEELITLVDHSEEYPSRVLIAPKGPFDGVVLEHYWTVTEDANNPTAKAWAVDFDLGGVFSAASKDDLERAWCVR